MGFVDSLQASRGLSKAHVSLLPVRPSDRLSDERPKKSSALTDMRKLPWPMAVVCGLVSVMTIGEPTHAETLTVGAAHSLKAPFQEILPLFEQEYGVTVKVLYGPSHTLSRQIEQGDPIDVFLSEGVEEVETLHKKGMTLNGGARIYAQTSLVLVMSTASPAASISLRDVLPDRTIRVALVDPKTSALGAFTAKALTKLDPIYQKNTNRSRLLRAQHSDDVVNLVSAGEAEVGIVYRADAINSGHVRIIDEVPGGADTPVQFGHAIVWTCRNESLDVAEKFFDFIMSPRIQKLLVKYGFDSVSSNG